MTVERGRIAQPLDPKEQIPLWKDFAVSLLERKVQAGDIESVSAIESFKTKLVLIIETAAWASMPLDEIRRAHIEDWRDTLPTLTWTHERVIKSTGVKKVTQSGSYAPRSLNSYLEVVAVVWKAALVRFELPRNPMEAIPHFSTKTSKAYTKEEPNALNPRTEVAEFLARFKVRYPQWYAFALLGFVLGQRPSTLRPLRRKGPNAHLDLVTKTLYIRRSNSFHPHVMDTTKTGNELTLSLPDELIEARKRRFFL